MHDDRVSADGVPSCGRGDGAAVRVRENTRVLRDRIDEEIPSMVCGSFSGCGILSRIACRLRRCVQPSASPSGVGIP